MSKDPELDVLRYGPKNGGKPKQLVIMLHGITNDASEVEPWPAKMAKHLPDAQFIMINAPFTYEGGLDDHPIGEGRQWFSIKNRKNYLKSWFQISKMSGILNRFIDKELKSNGLTDNQLGIFGFSQGAIMANYTAMRRENPAAAVVSHSGVYFGLMPAKSSPTIMVLHGKDDPTVPFDPNYADTIRLLKKAGASVIGVPRKDLEHDMEEKNMLDIAQWMRGMFVFNKDRDLKQEPIAGDDLTDKATRLKELIFGDDQKLAKKPKATPNP